ncbi:MAG: hypothetical protein E7163_00270 [Firmicutes bacterium]|nr:hypothetical protein [Bacillota bacterium]
MTLKDYIKKEKKENLYNFYCKLILNPKKYDSITRNDIYNDIISLYKKKQEIILDLCTTEEINVLKKILNDGYKTNDNSYIGYIINKNLQSNYLIIKHDDKYIIPKDILNYVKMALNIYNEKEFNFIDIFNSLVIGVLRIYNVLSIEDFNLILKKYNINIYDTKKDILDNTRFKDKLTIVKYKKKEYIVSLENYYYKDVLKLKKDDLEYKIYSLEEVISIGKYNINLFNLEIFEFLSFLELHLDSKSIELLLKDIITYSGFDINNETVLLKIADNIKELYNELLKVTDNFPVWIYKGNSVLSLKDEIAIDKKQNNIFVNIKNYIRDIFN